MSIYYQCRLKEVVLDLTSRSDIIQWLTNVKQNECKEIEKSLPGELLEKDRIACLHNIFEKDLNMYINFKNVNDLRYVTLDLCIGNKNTDDDIENLLLLFSKYYISGQVYYWDERRMCKVNLSTMRTDPDYVLGDDYISLIEDEFEYGYTGIPDNVKSREYYLHDGLE